jgi:hypothetical protein
MKVRNLIAITGALCLVASAFAALKLHSSSATVTNDNLTVKFDVSGLGNVTSAQFTLKASQDVLVTCINRGGNQPPGHIRNITIRSVNGTFPAINGRTQGALTIYKPAASAYQYLCPNGFAAVKVDVLAYKNVQLVGPNGQIIKTWDNISAQ